MLLSVAYLPEAFFRSITVSSRLDLELCKQLKVKLSL
jgi:hypothetical protein